MPGTYMMGIEHMRSPWIVGFGGTQFQSTLVHWWTIENVVPQNEFQSLEFNICYSLGIFEKCVTKRLPSRNWNTRLTYFFYFNLFLVRDTTKEKVFGS